MGDIAIDGVRCRDLDAWHRAVVRAPDLSTSRPDGRPRISSSQVKLVLLAMRAYFDGPGPGKDVGAHGRPGRDLLAEELGVSPATVQHAWAAGVAHGYLVRSARGRTGQSAEYAATLPRVGVGTTTLDVEGGSGPPQLSTKGGSGPPLSAESGGRDHREGGSGPPPPPHDLETPPPAGTREDGSGPGGGGGVVRDACEILAHRELDAEVAAGNPIRSRPRWLAAKVARLLETHGADLAAFADLVDATDGAQLLTAWDADRTQQRIAATARVDGHALALTVDAQHGPMPRHDAEQTLRSRWGHNEAAVIAGLDAFDHARQQQEVHA